MATASQQAASPTRHLLAGLTQPGPAPGTVPGLPSSAAIAAGVRIRRASVTSSASRATSTSASRSITSGQPSYPGAVKNSRAC
jgi:hypothetical protein